MQREKKEYRKPVWENKTDLSEKLVRWFENERKIKQETLLKMKISEGVEFMPQSEKKMNTVQFNYFRDGELVNIKYRTANKDFKMYSGAELIFYNLDCLKDNKSAIIVEGEIDALTLIQCGFENVVSVPNGASKGANNLQYLDNCVDYFEHLEEIIIATDNDIAGRKLRDDIAYRFGLHKCKYTESENWKDINELYVKDGMVGVLNAMKDLREFPIEGVFTVSDLNSDIDDMYLNGLDKGQPTGIVGIDAKIRFVHGYFTVVTGIPNHGKSDFVDQLCMKLVVNNKWKGAYYSPENKPTKLHFSKLSRKLTGKPWEGYNRITPTELMHVKNYLYNKVWFVKPTKDFTLTSILDHVKALKYRFGIDFFVIDAWNKLEHKFGNNETQYVGQSLDELGLFCEMNQVHCFLVVHPRKMEKDRNTGLHNIPTLYDLSGSANFFNKTDNGLTVYRDFESGLTKVFIQKVKFSHWGGPGMVEFQYHGESGRYIELGYEDYTSWIGEAYKSPKMEFKRVENDHFDNFSRVNDTPF